MGALMDAAKKAIEAAKSAGAEGARAEAAKLNDTRVEWRNGKLERMREYTGMNLRIEIFAGGRYSEHTTSDLRDSALKDFITEAVNMTAVLSPDPFRGLPKPALYKGRTTKDLAIYDPAWESQGIEACKKAASGLEEAVRDNASGAEIVSSLGDSSCRCAERAMATTNGMEGEEKETIFTRSCDVSLKDGDRTQPGWGFSRTRKVSDLPGPAGLGKEAIRRAAESMGSGPVETGDYAFIIENQAADRLLSMYFSPLRGSLIQQNKSFFADKIGKRIASPALTLTDDPHLPGGLGSTSFDSEGMASRTRPIIDKGTLENFFLDTYYANKLGLDPTTANLTNGVFATGPDGLERLIKDMDNGILITGFLGGNSNPATGDFSLGVRGMLIQRGERVRPVAGMNLSGNHLELWKRLAQTGNDPWSYGGARSPSMLFESGEFSGV